MVKKIQNARRDLDRVMGTKRTRYGRRGFLKGAGAITVGLPLLNLTSPKGFAAPGDHPKRLLIMSMGHSMDVNHDLGRDDEEIHLLPQRNAAGVLTQTSPVLQALGPHLSKINYVMGVDNLVAQSLASNGHNASGRTILGYSPHQGAAYNGDGSLADNQSDNPIGLVYSGAENYPLGPSINYFLGDQLGARPLNVRVGDRNGSHARDFYRLENGETGLDFGLEHPQESFDSIFDGLDGAPQAPTTLERIRRKKGSVLDAVLSQFNNVMTLAGAEDRERLDRHATHLREIERRIDETVQVTCDNPLANFPANLPALPARSIGDAREDDLFFSGHLDVIKSAFACQATQVAHLHFSNLQENKFPFMNGGTDLFDGIGWHAVVHHDDGEGPEAVAARLRSFQWYGQCLAEAIELLEATPEGNGTMMDNTLIVWISSLRKSSHATNQLPCVVAGNLQGELQTGKFLDLREHNDFGATLGDFWTSVANVMLMPSLANGFANRPVQSFGHNTGLYRNYLFPNGRPFQTGPLPGWLSAG